MFKVLFTIEYHNKQFLLLSTKEHRITFLEIKKNQLIYPQYEDFMELNKIYNIHEVLYSGKEMNYTEKVNWKGFLLSVVVSVGIVGGVKSAVVHTYEKTLELIGKPKYETVMKTRENIDDYYDGIITREDVVKVIEENSNISEEYKKIAIKVLDTNIEQDPEINLRVYYENLKTLQIQIVPKGSPERVFTHNYAGAFYPYTRTICINEEYKDSESVVAHEFNHTVYTFADRKGTETIDLFEYYGHSLVEAMTEQIIEKEYGDHNVYTEQQQLLNFLMKYCDNFNYEIYNKYGIEALIKELKEKYPNIDIDYIIDYMDAYTTSSHFSKTIKMIPMNYKAYLDELFKIAITKIDKDNPYKAFESFLKIIIDKDKILIEKYINEYNQVLTENNISKNNKIYLYNIIEKEKGYHLKERTPEEQKAFIDELFQESLENIGNYNNIYESFYIFSSFFRNANIENNILEEYHQKYEETIINKGFITKEQMQDVKSIIGLVKDGEDLYWIYDRGNIFDSINKEKYFEIITLQNEFHAVTTDELGFKKELVLNKGYFKYKNITDFKQEEIISWIAHHKDTPNIHSIENKQKIANDLNYFDNRQYNMFENGIKAFEKITPDLIVEIGITEKNDIGLILRNSSKVIYGTCKGLNSIIVTFPYELFSSLVNEDDGVTYNTIESIISEKYLNRIDSNILEYLSPNIKISNNDISNTDVNYIFEEPKVLKVDDKVGTSKDVYTYINFEKTPEDIIESMYVNIFGEDIYICDLHDVKAKKGIIEDRGFLDTYLDVMNIEPTYDNTYQLTKEEIINIIREGLGLQEQEIGQKK